MELQLEVDEGLISDALVHSDCMDAFAFDGVCDHLIGRRFKSADLARALDEPAGHSPAIRDLQGLIGEQDW